MLKRLELPLYLALIGVLSAVLLVEGRANAELVSGIDVAPKELYRLLTKSKVKLQVVDVRADSDEFEDTHVPGAIPFPNCDRGALSPEVSERILPYVPTIIVSGDGDAALFNRCKGAFKSARNLAGGLEGWSDESLPEDSGEYLPPKPGAGGGCL